MELFALSAAEMVRGIKAKDFSRLRCSPPAFPG
jgi:hypothetical protein